MPRIELRDPFGQMFLLTSSDPEIVKLWLIEHARLAVGASDNWAPWTMTVYPIAAPALGPRGAPVFDWVPVRDNKQGLAGQYQVTARALGGLAEWLEAERRGELHPPVPEVDYTEGLNPGGSLRGDQ